MGDIILSAKTTGNQTPLGVTLFYSKCKKYP
jgi:hypothetical protein